MTDTVRDRILDAAEARARARGYNGFSFRDLAQDVGIKSASIHYHFPTKANLAEALVRRYADRIRARLGAPAELSYAQAVGRLTEVFRDALLREDRMCLCGLFGAERDALPPEVAAITAEFFLLLLSFLTGAAERRQHQPDPARVLAQLEGGLILARTLNDPKLFEEAAALPPPPA